MFPTTTLHPSSTGESSHSGQASPGAEPLVKSWPWRIASDVTIALCAGAAAAAGSAVAAALGTPFVSSDGVLLAAGFLFCLIGLLANRMTVSPRPVSLPDAAALAVAALALAVLRTRQPANAVVGHLLQAVRASPETAFATVFKTLGVIASRLGPKLAARISGSIQKAEAHA